MADDEDPHGDRGPQNRPVLPKLRVLCLHDADSHAHEMQEAWEALGRRLHERHSIELVFVNSPLAVLATTRPPANKDDPRTSMDEPRRVWWHGDHQCDDADDDDERGPLGASNADPNPCNTFSASSRDDSGNDSTDTAPSQHHEEEEVEDELRRQPEGDNKPTLVGLDASLLYLQQVWSSKPYWGLLGAGQGATVASLFSLLPTTHPPPQCLVLCNANAALLPEKDRLSSVPCLHVGSQLSETLVAQFGGRVVRTMPRSSDEDGPPSRMPKSILNAVGRFLVEQRRLTLCDPNSSGGQIVALQAALHRAESDATDYIAREIAANPPKALMAIILPHHVGGWSGDRRRQPGEQGGGAPCPEEFLLHRDKRTAASEGASRHHPQSSDAKL